ncbi:hypothetical protein [Psychroflexus tropicus]|uniref:hypothetical protein n=1 Tax=Psychroflexus tropicus TaxID=197345 RepID=UPI000372CE7B|nr:hypothetical protein [Psychroflexus tropicus]
MTKIKNLEINGLRGVKEKLNLNLNKKSILIYGDNGTGKSSLTDSFEWFYNNHIAHLSTEEISGRGRDALRNIFISDDEDGYVNLNFDDKDLDAKKSIDGSKKIYISNTTDYFKEYIVDSTSENLILRYRDLVEFIIATKTEKLNKLQEIIGFSEVAKIRTILKRNFGRIKRTIKSSDYEGRKSARQETILENLGRNAYSDEQLFDGVNDLIKPLKLKIVVKSRKDINEVIKEISSKEDSKLSDEINFYVRVKEVVSELKEISNTINTEYSNFYTAFQNLQKEPEKIKSLQLLALLKEGKSVLSKDVVEHDYCPLCLQEKSKVQLIQELNARIDELEQLAEEKNSIDEQAKVLKEVIQFKVNSLEVILKDKSLEDKKFDKLKEKLTSFKTLLNSIITELGKEITEKIKEPQKVNLQEKELKELLESLASQIKKLKESKASNIKFTIHTKLLQTANAYKEYLSLNKEESVLRKQQVTFELLYDDFIRKQEESLNIFLSMFSKEINDYYTTMNPKEKVEDIRLIPLTKKEELVGITIDYKFFDVRKVPPEAYLSESHINCLGLSFFLASVKAFNKRNKFFVLDDVISSFDRSHRYRFAQLLTEKFGGYQTIVLTHEKEFFELVSSEVKSKGWLLRNFKWSQDSGTGIEKGIVDIKERILKKLEDRNTDGLGNDIRVYTEKVMKKVAFELEAKVAYRDNTVNEKRMAPELLDAVQSKLKASKELKETANIPKIKGMPMFVGNTTSHDNDFQASIEDLDAIWEDVKKMIRSFYCKECGKFISTKLYDPVKKKIRCGCENLIYDWKQ